MPTFCRLLTTAALAALLLLVAACGSGSDPVVNDSDTAAPLATTAPVETPDASTQTPTATSAQTVQPTAAPTVASTVAPAPTPTPATAVGTEVTVTSATYEQTFVFTSCNNFGENDFSGSGTVNGLQLEIDAEAGQGTLAIDGGSEQDAITLNGTISVVEKGDDDGFFVSGTWLAPNFAGAQFTASGTCRTYTPRNEAAACSPEESPLVASYRLTSGACPSTDQREELAYIWEQNREFWTDFPTQQERFVTNNTGEGSLTRQDLAGLSTDQAAALITGDVTLPMSLDSRPTQVGTMTLYEFSGGFEVATDGRTRWCCWPGVHVRPGLTPSTYGSVSVAPVSRDRLSAWEILGLKQSPSPRRGPRSACLVRSTARSSPEPKPASPVTTTCRRSISWASAPSPLDNTHIASLQRPSWANQHRCR